jgi:ketosteroid isomerase-like protein
MPDSNLALAKRGFEEYSRTGPSGVVDLMIRLDRLDPEFLFHVQEGLPTAGTYHGVEGYTKVTTEWNEAWSSFEIIPKEWIEADEDRIMVVVDQEAVARGSGVEVAAEFFYVLLFRDGRYRQMRLYGDRPSAERAMEEAGRLPGK